MEREHFCWREVMGRFARIVMKAERQSLLRAMWRAWKVAFIVPAISEHKS